jgi:hypothetical protein
LISLFLMVENLHSIHWSILKFQIGSTIQLRVSAKPIGWGDVDGLTESREVPIGPLDVAEPPEAKPRPRPARANGGLGKP